MAGHGGAPWPFSVSSRERVTVHGTTRQRRGRGRHDGASPGRGLPSRNKQRGDEGDGGGCEDDSGGARRGRLGLRLLGLRLWFSRGACGRRQGPIYRAR